MVTNIYACLSSFLVLTGPYLMLKIGEACGLGGAIATRDRNAFKICVTGISLEKNITFCLPLPVCLRYAPAKCGRIIVISGLSLKYTYSYFRSIEFCLHLALIPQFIPYKTTLSAFLVDKKPWGKKISRMKNMNSVTFVTSFFGTGSLPDAWNWWCMQLLGVGAL
jgi:hypothetical protein